MTQPPAGKVPSADTIVAPGDSHSSVDREGTRSYGGTSKAGKIINISVGFQIKTQEFNSCLSVFYDFSSPWVISLIVNVVLRCLLRKASCFAASKSTRENYGGSVSVERVDKEQRGSKSYGRNTSRGFRDRGSSGDRGRLRRR